jgi:hypothetical protein
VSEFTANTIDTALAPLDALAERTTIAVEFPSVVNAIGLLDEVIRRAREIKSGIEDVALKIVQRDGEQTIGPVRYYAGPTKTYKCRDVRHTLNTMLAMLDVDTLNDCLSSSAFKAATFRDAVKSIGQPDMFAAHFDTIEKWELREGKPSAKLQKHDARFDRRKPLPAAVSAIPDPFDLAEAGTMERRDV